MRLRDFLSRKGLTICCAERQVPSVFYILILCFFVLKNTVADEGALGSSTM